VEKEGISTGKCGKLPGIVIMREEYRAIMRGFI
jgi:hypothetical protein